MPAKNDIMIQQSRIFLVAYRLVDLMFVSDRRHVVMQAQRSPSGVPPLLGFGTQPKVAGVNDIHQ